MKSIENIELVWLDEGDDNIFLDHSAPYIFEEESPDTKLDVTVAYKKTALSEIVNFLLRKTNIDDRKNIMKKIKIFIFHLLLFSVYPNATKIKFSEKNDFREIIDLFKDDYGDQYIDKEDLKKIPYHSKVISMLINNKLLKEEPERYVVVDYYLKNLKLFDKKT